jgi:hypothetical protein
VIKAVNTVFIPEIVPFLLQTLQCCFFWSADLPLKGFSKINSVILADLESANVPKE